MVIYESAEDLERFVPFGTPTGTRARRISIGAPRSPGTTGLDGPLVVMRDTPVRSNHRLPKAPGPVKAVNMQLSLGAPTLPSVPDRGPCRKFPGFPSAGCLEQHPSQPQAMQDRLGVMPKRRVQLVTRQPLPSGLRPTLAFVFCFRGHYCWASAATTDSGLWPWKPPSECFQSL
jgi:hypothetical protein